MDHPQTPSDPQSDHDILVSLANGFSELNRRFNNFHQTFQGLSDNVAANTKATKDLKEQIHEVKDEVREVNQRVASVEVRLNEVETGLTAQINVVDARLGTQIKTAEERLAGQIKTAEERLAGQINVVDARFRTQINTAEERLAARIGTAENHLSTHTNALRKDFNKMQTAIYKLQKTTQTHTQEIYSDFRGLQGRVRQMDVRLEAQRTNELARLANSFVGNGTIIEPLVAEDMSRISDLPASDPAIDHLQGRLAPPGSREEDDQLTRHRF